MGFLFPLKWFWLIFLFLLLTFLILILSHKDAIEVRWVPKVVLINWPPCVQNNHRNLSLVSMPDKKFLWVLSETAHFLQICLFCLLLTCCSITFIWHIYAIYRVYFGKGKLTFVSYNWSVFSCSLWASLRNNPAFGRLKHSALNSESELEKLEILVNFCFKGFSLITLWRYPLHNL